MSDHGAATEPTLFGVIAEFRNAPEVLDAAEKSYAAGYRSMDAYTPMPVHGLAEAMGHHNNMLPKIIFCGGLMGLIGGFSLCYWVAAMELPYNIGGRPLNSWPSFIPVTFETTILLSAFSAVFGMLGLNGLPRPHHPVFGVEGFERASEDRFYLCIESDDAKFDPADTRTFLEKFDPVSVQEVAN